ncbi:hypothetical protein NEAUS06_0597 [Nematocida ausubeli]|nr:hypothetical protein NEAUS06_0597 [Nematocida ausubeli]
MKISEFGAGYFNLLKTIMGAGIISYPLFFAKFGSVTATILSCVAALLTFSSLIMLCECADYAKSTDKTFSAALSKVWPEVASFFNVVVFVKCFGVSISYLILLQPMLAYLLNMTGLSIFQNMQKMQVIFLYALIMFPICSMKDLKSLRYTSMIGIIGVYVCIGGSIYNYIVTRSAVSTFPETPLFTAPTYSWIGMAGQFIFSFTCHQNIFSIRASLKEPSLKGMKYIVGAGLSTALSLYLIFGMVIYITYGSQIQDNVFGLFVDGHVKEMVYMFYTVFISCSFPLQVYPARDCLAEWISGRQSKNASITRVCCTGAIVLVASLISLLPVSLSTIQTAVGGSASAIMCNFIPAICIMKIPKSKSPVIMICAFFLMAYGILAVSGVFIKLSEQISSK